MRKIFVATLFVVVGLLGLSQSAVLVAAQTTKVQLFFPSRSGSFTEGSTFEIPVLLNTHGTNINAVELHITFDHHKLQIVKPSNDKSIIAIWLEPPTYSNTLGNAKIIGTIPNGLVTDSGIVTTITFKALEPGQATIKIGTDSHVLANDGFGTDLLTQFDQATFTIVPTPPGGIKVFSETHPFDDHWYNNNSPVLNWESDPAFTGYSFILDNEPFTIPDNTVDSTSTVTSYQNLSDGIWYFHIKAQKNKIWGATTHFLFRIDTTAPAAFTPVQETLTATAFDPLLISFFTTDALSGIDHYEVGIVEKNTANQSTPIFVQTESPYQVNVDKTKDVRVIVRAYDRAGNIQTGSADVHLNFSLIGFIQMHATTISLLTALFLIALSIFHYLFGHHIARRLRRAIAYFKQSENEQAEPQTPPLNQTPPGH
jgi:hypothetical protein